jgi:uncharacterized protein (TIGR03067 family)
MNRRFASFATLLAIVSTVAAGAQTQTPPARAKIIASMQGAWLLTSSNGQDLSGSGQDIVITIAADKYTQTVNGQIVERGSFTIDETKKPTILDVTIAEGENAGAKQVGVVEVTGKTMRGKLSLPGATTRPTDLMDSEGFITFTAVKR